MKKIARRTAVCLLLVLFLVGGFSVYLVSFFKDGGKWVSFPVNRHAYSNAELAVGTVVDRNGVVLTTMGDGERLFNESRPLRRSTLHLVGDIEGNIGTGALSFYATDLMGYTPVRGVFSITGKGSTLKTTVDSRLNQIAYEALNGRKGAVSFYNYKTGEVLCMVSTPAYDPYSPPSEAELLSSEWDGAYINRCVSSSFTPGSVFKVVTLAAAIENIPDLFEMEFYCPGYVDIDGERINCAGVHNTCDINDAFANSCNVAFAELSQILGGEIINKYFVKFGFADSFKMSKIPVAKGGFTVAPDGSYNLSWSGIGQHEDLVNPLAMARLMAAIANKGVAVNPRIVEGTVGEFGVPGGFGYLFHTSDRLMKKATAETLSEMLRYNATSVYNNYYQFSQYDGLSAKSGTAEMKDGKAPHAWFVGFLNDDKYPIAFSVVIENAGWGLEQAGGVANSVLYHLEDLGS